MSKDSKRLFYASIIFLFFSLISIFLFVYSLNDYARSKTCYDELIYKEITLSNIEKDVDSEMGRTYYISAKEFEKIIIVNNLLSKKCIQNGIEVLNVGDILYCYLIDKDSSYELVELKTSYSTILSLEEHNKVYKTNAILGFVIFPIVFIVCLIIGIKFFMNYKKDKENFKMKKIIVIGCPGSGKSTFSKKLHEIVNIPLYHLDMMFWNSDKTTVPREEFLKQMIEVMATDSWIIDGNYASTIELRLKSCDTVFFLDYPLEVCLEGINLRSGKKRDDLPWVETEVDDEFISHIKNYNEVNRPKVLELLDKYSDKYVVTFKCRSEADEFLNKLKNNNK